jgi:hypothetical protein
LLLHILDYNQKSFATTDTDHRVSVAAVQVHLRPAQDRVVPRLPRDLVRLHRIRGRNCRKQVRNIVSVCPPVCPPIHGTVFACLSICPYFSLPHSCLSFVCLFVHMFMPMSVLVLFVHLFVRQSNHLFVLLSGYPCVCPFICPFIPAYFCQFLVCPQSIHLFVLLSALLLSIHLFVCLSIHSYFCLSYSLFICISLGLSILSNNCLPIHVFVHQSIYTRILLLFSCLYSCLTVSQSICSYFCLPHSCLSICFSVHLSHPHIHTSASLLYFHLIVCPLIFSNFSLSTCLSI